MPLLPVGEHILSQTPEVQGTSQDPLNLVLLAQDVSRAYFDVINSAADKPHNYMQQLEWKLHGMVFTTL